MQNYIWDYKGLNIVIHDLDGVRGLSLSSALYLLETGRYNS